MGEPMNNSDRGRITGMPGTKTTVTLYPQTLSARMRNSIIRMLESCVIDGGRSSKAKLTAQALSEQYGLQCSVMNSYYRGLRIVGITDAAAQEVTEIVHADWTAWSLENPGYRSGYYKDKYDNTMECLKRRESSFWTLMHDDASIRKVCEILAEHTTQEMKDKSKQVADMLRGTEPIHIITF
jgi:hypothetical protein